MFFANRMYGSESVPVPVKPFRRVKSAFESTRSTLCVVSVGSVNAGFASCPTLEVVGTNMKDRLAANNAIMIKIVNTDFFFMDASTSFPTAY